MERFAGWAALILLGPVIVGGVWWLFRDRGDRHRGGGA